MLNFREELSKIKENKMNRVDLQERVEDILKAILKYLNSLSLEQLNGEVKVSFYLHETGDSKTIQISVKHSGQIINILCETFDNREDAIKTSGLLKRYFVEKDFRYFNDVSSKYAFAVLINA